MEALTANKLYQSYKRFYLKEDDTFLTYLRDLNNDYFSNDIKLNLNKYVSRVYAPDELKTLLKKHISDYVNVVTKKKNIINTAIAYAKAIVPNADHSAKVTAFSKLLTAINAYYASNNMGNVGNFKFLLRFKNEEASRIMRTHGLSPHFDDIYIDSSRVKAELYPGTAVTYNGMNDSIVDTMYTLIDDQPIILKKMVTSPMVLLQLYNEDANPFQWGTHQHLSFDHNSTSRDVKTTFPRADFDTLYKPINDNAQTLYSECQKFINTLNSIDTPSGGSKVPEYITILGRRRKVQMNKKGVPCVTVEGKLMSIGKATHMQNKKEKMKKRD
jgi:hypothetical protein